MYYYDEFGKEFEDELSFHEYLEEIDERVKLKERVLVTTLTKRMAEELTKFLERASITLGVICISDPAALAI